MLTYFLVLAALIVVPHCPVLGVRHRFRLHQTIIVIIILALNVKQLHWSAIIIMQEHVLCCCCGCCGRRRHHHHHHRHYFLDGHFYTDLRIYSVLAEKTYTQPAFSFPPSFTFYRQYEPEGTSPAQSTWSAPCIPKLIQCDTRCAEKDACRVAVTRGLPLNEWTKKKKENRKHSRCRRFPVAVMFLLNFNLSTVWNSAASSPTLPPSHPRSPK